MIEKINKKTTTNFSVMVCCIILFLILASSVYFIIDFFIPSNDVNLGELQTWINNNNLTDTPYWVWEPILIDRCIKECGDLKYNGYTAECNYIVCRCGNKIRFSSC